MGVSRRKTNYEGGGQLTESKASKGVLAIFKGKMNLEKYTMVKGDNYFDIIPYEVTSKFNNLVHAGLNSVGSPAYVLPVFVHKNIGANNETVLCPQKNHGHACPICEAASVAWDEYREAGGDKEANAKELKAAKALTAQARVMYNIRVVSKDPEMDGRIMLLDQSDFKFQQPLYTYISEEVDPSEDTDARNILGCKRVNGFIDFADIDNGYTVRVKGEEAVFAGKKYIDVTGVALSRRKTPLTDEQLDQVLSLDECLIVKSYEELEDLLNGKGGSTVDADVKTETAPKTEEKASLKDDLAKTMGQDELDTPWDGDEKTPSSKCPFNKAFGEECDMHADCEKCFTEHRDVYKECMKLCG